MYLLTFVGTYAPHFTVPIKNFNWRAGFAGKVAREPKNIGLAGKVG
jgi:hypothetical protein